MDEGDDDPRVVELGSLAAIYPEMVVDADDPFTLTLAIPVHPETPARVTCLAGMAGPAAPAGLAAPPADMHELSYLPAVQVRVTLPSGYPEHEPPQTTVTADPPWLPAPVLQRLGEDGVRLWEEAGRDLVVFAIIDHVQQAADAVFGLVDHDGHLPVDEQHQLFVLDYDVQAKQAAFDRQTFDCGICLDPKKGVLCHRMQDCGHVFCVQCLQDYYNNAIRTGDLAVVRCPEPNCAKERSAKLRRGANRRHLAAIRPGELIQIPIPVELVQRYVDLQYKAQLETDKDTVFCPRPWCHGAARSKKRRRPEGFEDVEVVVEEEEVAADGEADADADTSDKQLAICEDCGFAFCTRCQLSWHGEFVYCLPPPPDEGPAELDMSSDAAATLRYLLTHTSTCPTCAVPVQKTWGCNHMICTRCDTHFCYLCMAWLDPGMPYVHYNKAPNGRKTECYQRLWVLEEGERAVTQEAIREVPPNNELGRLAMGQLAELYGRPAAEVMRAARAERAVQENRWNGNRRPMPRPPIRQIHVAREGPLVLQITVEEEEAVPAPVVPVVPAPVVPVVPAPVVPVVPPAPPAPGDRGGRGGRGRGRGGRRRGNQADQAAQALDDDLDQWVRHFVLLALEDNEDRMEEWEREQGLA